MTLARLAWPVAAFGIGVLLAFPVQAKPDEPDIENGRAIAVGAFEPETGTACFRCHGVDGAGDSAAAFPRLAGQVAFYLYDSLRDYASGLRPSPVMGPIAKSLDDDQMRDVAAYYASLDNPPYPPTPDAEGHLLQMGAAISAVGIPERGVQACVNCHGPSGAGLPPTYPFLAGQYANYLEEQLLRWRQGERRGGALEIMRRIAERMTDEQIRAVSLYFASVQPPRITPEEGP